jgi:non-reducing end alpha-L-arabinofuranosidase
MRELSLGVAMMLRSAGLSMIAVGLVLACGGRSNSHPDGGSPDAGIAGGGAQAGSSNSKGGDSAGSAQGGTASPGGEPGAGPSTGGRPEPVAGAGGEQVGGSGGSPPVEGPCDIYRDAGQPCAAAYSTVRRLDASYAGPLYQVRSGSSEQNTGSGGETHDVPQTKDGFASIEAVRAACGATYCTVSVIYDQSGNGNHLSVAKAGTISAGPYANTDDFEANAERGAVKVAGRDVRALYLEPRQGYRLPERGAGIPYREAAQGTYLLADGNREASGCCWEFGNAGKLFTFTEPVTLFFGSERGKRGAGNGPWFMADFGGGIWAGGSVDGDPGFGSGSLWQDVPPNPENPSLRSQFALGFLKVDTASWALRMADAAADAGDIVTAWRGKPPKKTLLGGTVILGISYENANESWGTFYEGAILDGFPSDDTERAVLDNIRATGYGR